MKNRHMLTVYRNRVLLVLVLGLVLTLCLPSLTARVAAQEELSLSCRAEYPALYRVILNCGPGGLWDGTIYIYNRQQQVNPLQPWQQNISQTNALWIFDARPIGERRLDGQGSLIIDYRPDGSGLRADLYDDQNGDRMVAYSVPDDGSEPLISENSASHPSVRVRTDENWWQRSGKTNYNLNLAIDGSIRGDFGSDVSRYYAQFKSEGIIDFTIEVRDNNKDGIADYDYRDSPVKGNYNHTSIMVSNETRMIPVRESLLWPFLAAKQWGFVQNYNQLKAPIQVVWRSAKIVAVGEFVPSRGRPTNWFVYSIDRVIKGQNSLTNFESPFAFYNLAGIDDGFPDLQVRFERYNPGEFVRDFQEPIQTIRYSWDQYHRQAWDYKVDLLGRHEITGTVQFNDFNINVVPYKDVPQWVMDRTWDQVNFVAMEGPGLYYTSEGIYDWPAQSDIREFYITGQADRYSLEPFEAISAGFRGEYRVAPDSRPRLYISSVDHKLHLVGAQGGLWNIDNHSIDHSSIRYADLNGDSYLDQWTYTRVIGQEQLITTTRQLDVAGTHLIYSDDQNVLIQQASVRPVLAEAMPPTNHEEWQSLGAILKAHRGNFEPHDLRAMIEQFGGPEMRIVGASLRNYRAIGTDGFRFVLSLHPDFQIQGAHLLDLDGLQPGEYIVSYDGKLKIAPMTPPSISGRLLVPGTARQLEIDTVQVMLRNDGREDVPEATLELWATPPNGPATLVVTQTVTLLAQTPITSTLRWSPRLAGQWTLTPQVRDTDSQQIPLESVSVTVVPAPDVNPKSLIMRGTYPVILPFIIVGMIVFAAIAAYIFWRRSRNPQVEQTDVTA